jgi:F-type H+-transporting ATPase subunit a
MGVGPWKALEAFPGWPKMGHEPFEIAAATTDFNVTVGLALVALFTYLGSGFWAHGIKYLKHYLNPIEWLDFVVRPATLALRLMLVISADEILRGVALTLVPWILPTGVMAFELFIGIIQAFVFALLTSIYIGLTVSHGSESHA